MSETSCNPKLPSTVWIILQTLFFFDCIACYLFHVTFSLTEFVLMLAFQGTPDMVTFLFFSVLAGCLF